MSRKTVSAFDVRLGRRLRQARLLKGLTQEQVAKIGRVSWQQFQKYELGQSRITAERLYAISKGLELPLGYFLQHGEDDGAEENELSDEALRLAGRIDALPDKLIRYDLSSLVQSINRAWDKRDRQ